MNVGIASNLRSKRADPDNWAPVADRIAFYDGKGFCIPVTGTMTPTPAKKTAVTPFPLDGNSLELFLHCLGEESASKRTVPPKLHQMASQWHQSLKVRMEERRLDTDFYHLSDELDVLDAILYTDGMALEMEALDILVSQSTDTVPASLIHHED